MIGIIGAMREEIELILENMSDKKTETYGSINYYIGKIGNKDIVLCQSGIGKVNSAIVTTTLIHIYHIEKIIFTGVAGGINPLLNLGDIVIGTDFLYHDFDATAIGYKLSEIPDKDEKSIFLSDPLLSDRIMNIAISIFGEKKVYRGRIISGDFFVASYEKIKNFQGLFDAYATDMESASVAHVANKYNIPCCIIRSISDIANNEASETYSGFFAEAAQKSADLVINFLKNR